VVVPRLLVAGGAPRTGKSALGATLLADGIPWLTLDVLRTVLREVVPDIDRLDTDPVDLEALAEAMYPHVERMADAALDQHGVVFIEGWELLPEHVERLAAGLNLPVRGVFFGNAAYDEADLAGYQGSHRWHERLTGAERAELVAQVRALSLRTARACERCGQPFFDVGEVGFDAVITAAREHLLVGQHPTGYR
jgi:hypothetical protein